jgi:Fic family protein
MDYYRHLRDVTRLEDWEVWVTYMINGVEETAQWTTPKIEAIRKLQAHTIAYVRQSAPKVYSHELMDLIF